MRGIYSKLLASQVHSPLSIPTLGNYPKQELPHPQINVSVGIVVKTVEYVARLSGFRSLPCHLTTCVTLQRVASSPFSHLTGMIEFTP